MKKNFYKKSISLLLASCMTLGTGVSAIATEIADDFRKESIEATEIEKPEEETPKTEETNKTEETEGTVTGETEKTEETEGTVTGETEKTEETEGTVTGEAEKTEETEGTVIDAELIQDIATTLEIKAAEKLPEGTNLARVEGVTATATNSESGTSFTADKAIDGNRTEKPSRWATDVDVSEPTITLDLGALRSIKSTVIYWEAGYGEQVASASKYYVETSVDGEEWTTQATRTEKANAATPEVINFDNAVEAQYIRVRIAEYSCSGWNNVSMYELEVYQEDQKVEGGEESGAEKLPAGTNLATVEGVTATVTDYETGTQFTADKAIDGNHTDGSSRWATNRDVSEPTLTLDLGALRSIRSAVIYWEAGFEADTANASKYYIETSVDGDEWTTQATRTEKPQAPQTRAAGAAIKEIINFDEDVEAQYIRVRIKEYSNSGWNNVSMYEFEVYQEAQEEEAPSQAVKAPEGTNLARYEGTTASATDYENGTQFTADKAIDGNKKDKPSRWATNMNAKEPTITLDFKKIRSVNSVIIYWEAGLNTSKSNASKYYIETSLDGEEWTTQSTRTEKADASTGEIINFDKAVDAKYLRVRIAEYSNSGWNNVSMYELEAYQEKQVPKDTAANVAKKVTLEIEDGKVVAKNLTEGFDITFAANYEQVVGADGTIYTPLVDMNIEFDITAVNQSDPEDKAIDMARVLTIPGQHSENEGNAKPKVVPEITEWYSSSDEEGKVFELTSQSRIVLGAGASELGEVSKNLQADILNMFGWNLEIVTGQPEKGDIYLTIKDTEALPGYDDETYEMKVRNFVTITAIHPTGINWGTRSALQALTLSGDAHTIDQGTAKDYPEFRLRGFMIDVGRKPFSMDMLKQVAKTMEWFKLNDLHVHLSDNLIFMEDYGSIEAAWNAYDGFRLESDREGNGHQLQSKDYYYTNEEFRGFIDGCKAMGVNVVPEIDVPAHALSIAKVYKELALHKAGGSRPWIDHMDISNPEAIEVIKDIFREYIENGTFGDEDTVVHIGADEFYDSHPAYRNFLKEMITFIEEDMGRQVRVWGSLTSMSNNPSESPFTPEDVKGAQLDIWNTGWANPKAMFDLGFDLINITDGPMYMVPNGNGNRGGYGDYLDPNAVYSWTPNNMGGTKLPASSSQVLGGSFAIWQDNIDTRAAGINEQDTFVRMYDAIIPASVKMWGEGGDGLDRTVKEVQDDGKIIGLAPGTNPLNTVEKAAGTRDYASYDFESLNDKSGNNHNLTLNGAEINNGALSLNGGSSYASTGLDKMAWGDKLSFKVKKTAGGALEQVIFESDHAYGDYAIKAIRESEDATTWKLGFSRELYDYVFDYDLPENEWVDVEIVSEELSTKLIVNGQTVSAVGSFLPDENSNSQFKGKTGITNSSFSIPVSRIGSTTNAFTGLIDNVVMTTAQTDNVMTEGKYDISVDKYANVTAGSSQSGEGPQKAIDEDTTSIWHSNWNGCSVDESWIQVELDEATVVSGFRYLPRPNGINGTVDKYLIQVSMDGEEWTDVATGVWNRKADWKTVTFDAVEAKYVRLKGLETATDSGKRFMSAAEIRVCVAPNISEAKVEMEEKFEFDGKAVTPEPKVVFEGYLLEKDVDYTLSYENNEAPGEAKVIITGAGMYTGTFEKTFTITGDDKTEDNNNDDNNTSSGGGHYTVKPTRPGESSEIKDDDVPMTETPETVEGFKDVFENSWFKEAVEYVTENNIFAGITPAQFGPDMQMTRGMLATVLYRIEGQPEVTEASPFKDVTSDKYYADAIAWAASEGIVAGITADEFAPDSPITREQLATILYRYNGSPKVEKTAEFTDSASISTWAIDAVNWAVENGIISGRVDGKLDPQGKATRAEVASMVMRMSEIVDKVDETEEVTEETTENTDNTETTTETTENK
ncbi:MAG TPA: discoidin domain-containing protein [Candidatus Fimicola cottocaccae]|nr:discoidin domain-containing protein [Candidatus Fimicola cottocaccae]